MSIRSKLALPLMSFVFLLSSLNAFANEIIQTSRCTLIPLIYPQTLNGFVIENFKLTGTYSSPPEMVNQSADYAHSLWLALREESTGKACNAHHSDESATKKWLSSAHHRFAYLWAVTQTETHEVMGFVALWPYTVSEEQRVFSISGGGAEAFRSQHYGREVLKAVLEFAPAKLGVTSIQSAAFDWNIASQRLQEEAGFKRLDKGNRTEDSPQSSHPKLVEFEMNF